MAASKLSLFSTILVSLSEFAASKHVPSLEFLEINPCSIKYESLSRTSNSEIDDC